VVKVLGGQPKRERRKVKHHTTFCVQQQPSDNTCDFYVFLNKVAFGAAELRCKCKCIYFTLLSTFMINCVYSSFANIYIFLILSWQDYENAFINVQSSSFKHIRERLARFIVSEVISSRREFHFSS
jgi:hypothetical protein